MSDFESLIPADRKLSPDWIKALYETGEPEVFSGDALRFIGMPIGGIGCGQLYLGGDGRLWLWDIFRTQYNRAKDSQRLATKEQGGHYVDPPTPDNAVNSRNGAEVDQGFVIRVKEEGKTQTRFLDERGFSDQQISFRGEYPVGRVSYLDKALPVSATLEAFSPFIPLRAEDSAIPATVL
ncbi:MAG TPA: GH116 family glycosyl-hydrolase, partial [Acidobacteriota bacterium]|nr:GH116 family glycosyl-hydrolase [Acidobacteriota bacterium]